MQGTLGTRPEGSPARKGEERMHSFVHSACLLASAVGGGAVVTKVDRSRALGGSQWLKQTQQTRSKSSCSPPVTYPCLWPYTRQPAPV